MVSGIFETFLHFDKYLSSLIFEYGLLIYVLLFIIVLCETGLVIAPFLPGDSLLFAAGSLAAIGSMDLTILFFIFTIAAILGDALNYHLGYFFGPKIFRKDHGFLFNRNHLVSTERFYHNHGPKTIIIARFLPIVRTFAPFVAGIGNMNYPKFLLYNVIGALGWVILFLGGGYLFGNIPVVKNNFGIVILVIIAASFLPVLIKLFKKD